MNITPTTALLLAYTLSKQPVQETPPPPPVKTEQMLDKKFWAGVAFLYTTTTLDIKTTIDCRNRGACQEAGFTINTGNVNKGHYGKLYATQYGIDAGLTFLAYELRKHHQKTWYAPFAIVGGIHGFAAIYNKRF